MHNSSYRAPRNILIAKITRASKKPAVLKFLQDRVVDHFMQVFLNSGREILFAFSRVNG